jgi:SOS response regulatory protein OraA/RecX
MAPGAPDAPSFNAMRLLAVRSHTREALRYSLQRRHLRRTVRIALVVGVVLTAINQLDVIVSGDATTTTWVKCGLNFVVPFVVSNLGLLRGRATQ